MSTERICTIIRSGKARPSAAFTVIEVMVALAIFVMMAVVLAAAYLNVLNAYDAVGKNPQRDVDVRYAREALLAEPDLETAEKGDTFEDLNGHHITWTATIEPTTTADLFTVTFHCEVTAPELSQPQTVNETFRVLRPTWSQGADRSTLRAEAKDRILQAQQPAPLASISGASSNGGNSTNKRPSSGGTGQKPKPGNPTQKKQQPGKQK